jgi:hypothetical protein
MTLLHLGHVRNLFFDVRPLGIPNSLRFNAAQVTDAQIGVPMVSMATSL